MSVCRVSEAVREGGRVRTPAPSPATLVGPAPCVATVTNSHIMSAEPCPVCDVLCKLQCHCGTMALFVKCR